MNRALKQKSSPNKQISGDATVVHENTFFASLVLCCPFVSLLILPCPFVARALRNLQTIKILIQKSNPGQVDQNSKCSIAVLLRRLLKAKKQKLSSRKESSDLIFGFLLLFITQPANNPNPKPREQPKTTRTVRQQ